MTASIASALALAIASGLPWPAALPAAAAQSAPAAAPVIGHDPSAATVAEISWDDLVPPDWDPMKTFDDAQDLANLPDTDPRILRLYDRVRKVWDEAPTVAAMSGRTVRLPGYVVPIEQDRTGVREFLLVPYFGACIHTPPPPANQIIHVRAQKPITGLRTMDAVEVVGTLGLARSNTEMGKSGYTMATRTVKKLPGQ